MKLHVGAGTVYLDGWLNIGLRAHGVCLAKDRPDLIEKWRTSEEAYYARHMDKDQRSLRDAAITIEEVCDIYGSFARLPTADEEASEILARQVFEHLSLREARLALDECDRALAPGGVLRLDVPDHDESLKRLRLTDDPFFARHMLGSRRDEAAYHVMAYTRDGLRSLCEEHGFAFICEEKNIHFYPAFCLRFEKSGPRPAWRYVDPAAITTEPTWRIAEFGPGCRPWPRADIIVDREQAFLDAAPNRNELERDVYKILFDLDTVCDGMCTMFDKGELDFVYASHILEHVKDPVLVAAEFSRIGKRGCVVCPSILKEGLFAFEEGEHRWWCLPSLQPNTIRMLRADYAWRERVADSNASGALARVMRIGPFRLDHDARVLRRWFRRIEAALDVVVPWEGELKVEIL